MKNFYDSFTFIIAFMVLVLVFQMFLGNTFVEWFLLLVLLSMVVMNSEKFAYVFKGLREV